MLAQIGSLAMTGLLATEYFTPVQKAEIENNPFYEIK